MTDTVEKIARDFVENLSFDDLQFLRGYPESAKKVEVITKGLPGFPSGRWRRWNAMCRHIRNQYGLWYDNPLTRNWRENESSRDMRDGVDYSVDHPDNISLTIFEKAVTIVKEEYFDNEKRICS